MLDRRPEIIDELLIVQAQAGDRRAFERLVRRWQERLWRHAFRLTGREATAWDVLQESWLAITGGIRGLRDPAHFRAWAYAIVTKQAALSSRRGGDMAAIDDVDCVPSSAPEAVPDGVARLRVGLGRLAGPDRALLALKYDEGFTVDEIARILDVPAGTVKSRLHQARERLRGIIEAIEDDERSE